IVYSVAVGMAGLIDNLETEPEAHAYAEGRPVTAAAAGLVVLFSSEEPEQVGAWIPIFLSDSTKPRIFGRGSAQPDDEFPRLGLFRQRPGQNQPLGTLENRAISRRQLLVRPMSPDTLHVTNVGRCPLSVNGVSAGEVEVRPGD